MAVPEIGNLVHETSTSTGTGNFTVSAVDGRQRLSDIVSTGGTTRTLYYFISHRTASEWEVGYGHLSATSTLVRDEVLASSNSDAAVNFTAGTKDVTNDIPKSVFKRNVTDKPAVSVRLSADQTLTSNTATLVQLDSEFYDHGNYFDTTNHRYVPPPGIYRCSFNADFTTTNGVNEELLRIFFRRDGSDRHLHDGRRSGTGTQGESTTGLIEMDGTQMLEVWATKGGAGDGGLNGTTSTCKFDAEFVREIDPEDFKINEDEYLASTGTGTSITIPAVARVGDVCLVFNKAEGPASTTPADVTPSGFTKLATDAVTSGSQPNVRGSVFCKILVDGDPGSSVTGLDGATEEEWIVIVLYGNKRPAGFATNSINEDGRTGNPGVQTISASGETNLPAVAFALYAANNAVNPRTSSVTMNEEQGNSTDLYAKFLIYNDGDTPANTTVDMDDEGSNVLLSGYIDFSYNGTE